MCDPLRNFILSHHTEHGFSPLYSRESMIITLRHLVGFLVIGLILGIIVQKYMMSNEGFRSAYPADRECKQPDMNKYVLKSTIPPCPALPDMSNYILKSECPPVPDLSNYVLKSSIPKQSPVILDCSKCQKPSGECPPCPRARCPEVKCPPATKCPSCAPCPRQSCPPATVSCKANNEVESTVRPYLAPLSFSGFGMS